VSSGLDLDTFGFTFVEAGTYVFGDYSAPDQYQTIVKVTSDATRDGAVCRGQKSWPITADNMRKLQITTTLSKLKSYDDWLHQFPHCSFCSPSA